MAVGAAEEKRKGKNRRREGREERTDGGRERRREGRARRERRRKRGKDRWKEGGRGGGRNCPGNQGRLLRGGASEVNLERGVKLARDRGQGKGTPGQAL